MCSPSAYRCDSCASCYLLFIYLQCVRHARGADSMGTGRVPQDRIGHGASAYRTQSTGKRSMAYLYLRRHYHLRLIASFRPITVQSYNLAILDSDIIIAIIIRL